MRLVRYHDMIMLLSTCYMSQQQCRHILILLLWLSCQGANGEITDLCSFYFLPSTVIGNELHDNISAAYSFYNVATSTTMEELMRDSLVLARDLGVDVFNALDLMENLSFLENLKFGIGDGFLQYYLYNWQCPDLQPKDVGIVLM